MLDLAITGGMVVDGTGVPPRRADVGVRDGRVVAIGDLDESARDTRDADGLVVAPGFVDIHTHQDAQVFWDPACTPSPQFGCTSVIAGNCGFSIAPIDGADADFMMRMLARVEGIPLATLEVGVPWTWNTFAEYLDAVEAARPAVNMGVMVGHSAVRRSVLGADGGRAATADELVAMQAIVDAAVAAGAIGFSSSWAPTHVDGTGEPVPSRFATSEEVIALAEIVGRYPGTQLEFIPTTQVFEAVHIDTMIGMSRAAGRPVNWNVLIPRSVGREATEAKLTLGDTALERGARVLALSYPDVIRARATFRGTLYDGFPGWARVMTLPDDEKLVALQDPDTRARLLAASQSEEAGLMRATLGDWGGVVLAETQTDRYRSFVGKTFGEIAAAFGTTPFEALLDAVVTDQLATSIIPVPPGDDPESWAFRERTWHDPRVVLGASDAGAHVDMIWTYDWACAFLSRVRERDAMPIEAAVRRVSGELAELYGLVDRGHVAVGAHADLVLFDADEIGPGLPEWRDDLPGGAGRLTGAATGIESVFVNGTEIVQRGELTGAQPGKVLRSGIDTL